MNCVRRRAKAIAILMVVLILSALVAIAVPYALSMGLHERKARSFRDTTRARLAAEGAVAHAIAVLRRTEDQAEATALHGPPWNTPDYDTAEEFRVTFDFGGAAGRRLRKGRVTFDDPRGSVWSVRVEDEQGKINILSAPDWMLGGLIASGTLGRDLLPGDGRMYLDDASAFFTDGDPRTVDGLIQVGRERISYRHVDGSWVLGLRRDVTDELDALRKYGAGRTVYAGEAADIGKAARAGRLRTLHDMKRLLGPNSARKLERIEPYVTTTSYRESHTGWLRREEVLNGFGTKSEWFVMRDAAGLGPGTRVRFVVDDEVRDKIYLTTEASRRGERWHVRIEPDIGFDRPPDVTVYMEGEQRHPVNVNTAPLAVLKAVFTGVRHSRGGTVSREEAAELAEFVHDYVRGELPGGKPLASESDVEAMFESARASRAAGEGFGRRKVEALVLNATVANSPELRRSSLPFCYKSYGNFTIEAAALVNTPAGGESARYVMRELVSLPVSSGGRWTLSSQRDFDEQMKRLAARKVVTWPFAEPPSADRDLERYTRGLDPRTGRDTEGFVRPSTAGCADDGVRDHFDVGRRTLQGSYEATPDGARLEGGTLWTGGSGVFKLYKKTCKPVLLEAWFRRDRRSLATTSFTAFSAFAEASPPRNGIDLVHEKNKFVLRVSDACIGQQDPAGWDGMPWRGPARYEFDLAARPLDPGDWYHIALQMSGTGPNDVSLWIDGRPLVNTQGLDDVVYRPGTRLADALAGETGQQRLPESKVKGCQVIVESTQDFPKDGAILVDGEVIEYESKDRMAFRNCLRGRRYTNLAEHAVGAVVVPYGYTVPLARELKKGNAEIASNMKTPANRRDGPQTTLPEEIVTIPGPIEIEAYALLEEDAETIPVDDASGFQNSGYAILQGFTDPKGTPTPFIADVGVKKERYTEFFFFASVAGDKKSLKGCLRRQLVQETSTGRTNNTTREFRLDGLTMVRQISIAVKNFDVQVYGQHMENKDASPRPPVGSGKYRYACIRPANSNLVEWIRLEHVDASKDPKLILGAYRQNNTIVYRTSMRAWRGQLGTGFIDDIPSRSKLLPVFPVAGPQCGHPGSFRELDLDRVTVMDDGGAEPNLRGITHAHCFERWYEPVGWLYVFRVSLDEQVSRQYPKDKGRLLKFPSGEMPRKAPDKITVGSFKGTVDEFRAREFTFRPLAVARGSPVLQAADEIVVMREMATNGANRATVSQGSSESLEPPQRGIARIDDELIYYANRADAPGVRVAWGAAQHEADKMRNVPKQNAPGVEAWKLTGCLRGVLGTVRAVHADGARVTFLPGLSVTHVLNSGDDDKIGLADASGFPEEGFAVMRPSTQASSMSFHSGEIIGWERKSSDWLEGIEFLRARFGTNRGSIRDSDLVQHLPSRYWSRYVTEHDGSELAYFQTSVTARGANWQSVEWTERDFDGMPVSGMDVRVVCRFDGKPGWETRPSNRVGGLWEFRGAGRHAFVSARGSPVVADSVDVRVYFSYTRGAWAEDSNDWKRTLGVENFVVTFGSPLVVRKVDLLDY